MATAAAQLLSKGAIAGIVIGVIFGVLIMAAIVGVMYGVHRRGRTLQVRARPTWHVSRLLTHGNFLKAAKQVQSESTRKVPCW